MEVETTPPVGLSDFIFLSGTAWPHGLFQRTSKPKESVHEKGERLGVSFRRTSLTSCIHVFLNQGSQRVGV